LRHGEAGIAKTGARGEIGNICRDYDIACARPSQERFAGLGNRRIRN
jgi:hypothetical protein